MPFCPSHVECVDPQTGKYIGQHMSGGMLARDPGYDVPFRHETFVDLPTVGDQEEKFYAAARAAIGEPYDWRAILGFVLPGHFHTRYEAICSAKIFLLLRDVADWFPSHCPVCVPAHLINPRDLMLMISVVTKVEH